MAWDDAVYGDPERFRRTYWEHIPPKDGSMSILPVMGRGRWLLLGDGSR